VFFLFLSNLSLTIRLASISPDGRTLLSVGDSSKVYLHRMAGGSRIDFTPISTLCLPPPEISPLIYPSPSLAASFSTAFSSNGTKFAVASQEGVVVVWDVRSSKPLKVFQTDKTKARTGNGNASGWLSDDPWDWTRGHSKAPGWSVRSVKFGNTHERSGKEIMTFTEVSK
jgi:WD40 repeat protein